MMCVLAIGPLLIPVLLPCPPAYGPPPYEPPRYERRYRPPPMPRPPEDTEPAYRGSSIVPSQEHEAPQPAALTVPERKHLQMTPADLYAIANLRIPQLPPPEYDYIPDDKKIVVRDVESEQAVRVACNLEKIRLDATIIGCADARNPDVCYVYLGPIPEWTGITRNINLRHELAHCNNWPGDHPGIR